MPRDRNRATQAAVIRPAHPLIAAALIFSLAIPGCTSPQQNADFHLRTEQSQAGDTVIVRHFGTNSPRVHLVLAEEIAISTALGHEPELFGRIMKALPLSDGGVVITEFQPYRIEGFDSAGKFVRSYGRRGQGPGEFMVPSFIAQDSDGNLHHWNPQHGVLDVYARDGKLLRSWAPKWEAGAEFWMQNGSINSEDVFSAFAAVSRPEPGKDGSGSKDVVVTATLDGKLIREAPRPDSYGALPPKVSYRVQYSGRESRESTSVPASPQFSAWYVPPGFWASAHSGTYRILIHRNPGYPLIIESDLRATPIWNVERADLAAEATAQMQFTDKSAQLSQAEIPQQKPFFHSVTGDQSDRLWVRLNVPGTRKIQYGCPSNNAVFGGVSDGATQQSTRCADGLPKREIPSWEMPSTFDVFLPSGQFAGRLTLPDSTTFLNAKDNKLWVRRIDSLGVNSLVRFRISARAGSRLEEHWRDR